MSEGLRRGGEADKGSRRSGLVCVSLAPGGVTRGVGRSVRGYGGERGRLRARGEAARREAAYARTCARKHAPPHSSQFQWKASGMALCERRLELQ